MLTFVTNPEHRFFARSILAMVVVSDARSEIHADIMALQKHALHVKTGRLVNVGSLRKASINFLT